MKQLAQFQDGRIELQEVPRPVAPPGGILVRVTHSVISIGTEKMKVEQARMNLFQKARARPDQVRKVLDTARNLGWRSALEKVRNRLESPTPLGYSAAGVVVSADAANGRFKVGDRVACGGAECSFHAEYIGVPDLLAAPIPATVPSWNAAYTTLCAIALQAVRQTEPRLGDRVLVMGQGLVGLIITNLLSLSGARVMAVDVLSSRRQYCHAMGAEKVVILGEQNLADEMRLWTEGYGADAAIIGTASASNTPIEQAAEALRDRGRIVVVGNTRTELLWKDFTAKEIEVRFSRAYGPGRYDPNYEWGGNDYPIGYVRWTEQRNFQACLRLMAEGRIHLEAITTRRVPFLETLPVYRGLANPGDDIGIVLEYSNGEKPDEPGIVASREPMVPQPSSSPATDAGKRQRRLTAPVERLDVIGAGNFARTMLLPHLKGNIQFGTVVNQTALSANHARTKFGFESAETNADAVLTGSGSGAVMIATRHHLHARLVKQALAAGRHVFVEKPLCLTREELAGIDAALATSAGTIQVGFNRRFAPASLELKHVLSAVPGAKMASFRVVPGKLDPQHWYANFAESGGRVLGEVCHFLDYFRFLFDSVPLRVTAQTIGPIPEKLPFADGVAAQVEFADGSCGQLIYTAEGDPAYPKETLTVFGPGVVAEIVNFQELVIHRGRGRRKLKFASKGHAEEMAAWLAFLKGTAEHPLPYEESRWGTVLSFAVLESIRESRPVSVQG